MLVTVIPEGESGSVIFAPSRFRSLVNGVFGNELCDWLPLRSPSVSDTRRVAVKRFRSPRWTRVKYRIDDVEIVEH
ncbi:hypothetical protein EYF80_064601 [Liparis tanakae]|uniref:Uncharacterized protein n=1 Tax=Liparis tanakae TaxID=230148 RepID=A0A4Z2EAI5_9TELE|nr:hypothetical protein EYF80_064601 [Liparis tanakae]